MRSVRYQGKNLLLYAGLSLGICFAAIFYTLLFGHDETLPIVYYATSLMMLAMFLFIFTFSFFSLNTSLALSFGATRRHWFWAGVISKALFAIVCGAVFILVIEPFAMWVYGYAFAIRTEYLLLAAGISLFLSFAGGMLGTLTLRYGMKWMLITILLFVLAIVGSGLFLLFTDRIETALNLLQAPWLPLIPLAACVPMEAIDWILLRRIPVKQ